MNKKGLAPILIILGVLITAIAVAGITLKNLFINTVPKACTQEVKLCPDGSSVGRSGPNCEFSPCSLVVPSNPQETNCGSCPQLMPSAPDFCQDGKIISGGTNQCGCQLPPTCQR